MQVLVRLYVKIYVLIHRGIFLLVIYELMKMHDDR